MECLLVFDCPKNVAANPLKSKRNNLIVAHEISDNLENIWMPIFNKEIWYDLELPG